MSSRKIIYSRGFPYGAPKVMLRGGGLNISGVKGYLREQSFVWNGASHAYESYLHAPELRTLLCILRDAYGCEIVPKDGMDTNYMIDLEPEAVACPACGSTEPDCTDECPVRLEIRAKDAASHA